MQDLTNKGKIVKREEEDMEKLFQGIMEVYNDSVISPLSYFSQDNINASTKEKGSGKRERNETAISRMSKSFSILDSMVPNLFNSSKRRQENILVDTMTYINLLEEELTRLETEKKSQLERTLAKPALSICTSQNSSVGITVSDHATFLAIQRPHRPALLQDIVKVLVKHGANVLEARVSVSDEKLLTFTATMTLGSYGQTSTIEKIKEEISCL